MIRKTWTGLLALLLVGFLLNVAAAQRPGQGGRERRPAGPKIGEIVKDFELSDIQGKKVHLSDFTKKKQVFVLELGACT
jgi:cytochrome oxidase Cu insertion factor (SCO1/SenC/PrrC family)